MNTLSVTVRGGLVVLALALLAGCAFTTGGGPSRLGLNAAPSATYTVCDGVHASRLPQREATGRVCQPSTSLEVIL
jgi:hypothetical protein